MKTLTRNLLATLLLLSGTSGFADRVTLRVENGTIAAAAELLSEKSSTRIHVLGGAEEIPMDVNVEDASVQDALNAITNPTGLIWWKEDNGDYGITTRRHYERNLLPSNPPMIVFVPEHIDVVELGERLRPLLTPGRGTLVADQRTAKVIVVDYREVLDQMRALEKEWDVPSPATLARGDDLTTTGLAQRPAGMKPDEVLASDTWGESDVLAELERRREQRLKARMSEKTPHEQPPLPSPH